MIKEKRPQAVVSTDRLLTAKDNVRLRPDLVVEEGNQVTIVDFAVTWDANEGVLIRMCAAKRTKYASLKEVFPDRQVQVFGMAFGARYMIRRKTLRVELPQDIKHWFHGNGSTLMHYFHLGGSHKGGAPNKEGLWPYPKHAEHSSCAKVSST
ncbi:hypothetical protein HPB50_008774 [Hyalomma asiaticum]|uniref:Uncharacterized protein n=1 Tax=Hyalomma asiaticum TaxID=266040 RepID=A0ACB7S7Q4_HYAAI|nr:hypothetical protein HPB50_008774 [Hyalomma asiaticum]